MRSYQNKNYVKGSRLVLHLKQNHFTAPGTNISLCKKARKVYAMQMTASKRLQYYIMKKLKKRALKPI